MTELEQSLLNHQLAMEALLSQQSQRNQSIRIALQDGVEQFNNELHRQITEAEARSLRETDDSTEP
jgi:hypothetical protein